MLSGESASTILRAALAGSVLGFVETALVFGTGIAPAADAVGILGFDLLLGLAFGALLLGLRASPVQGDASLLLGPAVLHGLRGNLVAALTGAAAVSPLGWLSGVAPVALAGAIVLWRTRAGRNGFSPATFVLERFMALRAAGGTVVQDPRSDWYKRQREERQARLRQHTFREPPPGLSRALDLYAADLRKIVDTTRQERQRLVLVTQPTVYRKDLPESIERLLWMGSVSDGAYAVDVLEKTMDAFNRTLIAVALQSGVDHIDLASMLPKDTSTFYDDAHFNDSGSEKVATGIAEFLVTQMSVAGSQR